MGPRVGRAAAPGSALVAVPVSTLAPARARASVRPTTARPEVCLPTATPLHCTACCGRLCTCGRPLARQPVSSSSAAAPPRRPAMTCSAALAPALARAPGQKSPPAPAPAPRARLRRPRSPSRRPAQPPPQCRRAPPPRRTGALPPARLRPRSHSPAFPSPARPRARPTNRQPLCPFTSTPDCRRRRPTYCKVDLTPSTRRCRRRRCTRGHSHPAVRARSCTCCPRPRRPVRPEGPSPWRIAAATVSDGDLSVVAAAAASPVLPLPLRRPTPSSERPPHAAASCSSGSTVPSQQHTVSCLPA